MVDYAIVTYRGGGTTRRIRRNGIYFWKNQPVKVTDITLINFFKRKPESFTVVEYPLKETVQKTVETFAKEEKKVETKPKSRRMTRITKEKKEEIRGD